MSARVSRYVRFAALALTVALAGGCGSSGSSGPAATPPSSDAQNHFQALFAGGTAPESVAREGAYFADYYTQHPADPAASLGYAVTHVADAVGRLAAKYGLDAGTLGGLASLQGALRSVAVGEAARVARGAMVAAAGRGLTPFRGTRAEGSYPPAEVAADLRAILMPALRDAIQALGPAVAWQGAIVSFQGEEGVTHVSGVDALAYRAALEGALALAGTACAYSWESGDFVWNRPPAEMDADADGLLTPAEYLPGGTYLTLVDRPAMAEAWTSLNAALADAQQVAAAMAAGAPGTLLADAAPEADWAVAQLAIAAARQALSAPTAIPLPIEVPGSATPTTINLTVNLGAFWVNPPADLRLLAPTFRLTPGATGETEVRIASIPDKSFGGLLPRAETEIPALFWLSLYSQPLEIW